MFDQSDSAKPAIVLAHGAWADASSWNSVIAQLHTAGYNEKAPSAEGWKTIPSWYVVGDADLVIPPAVQLNDGAASKGTDHARRRIASEYDSTSGSDR